MCSNGKEVNMKLMTIILLFIAQTHGSWMGDIDNAMSSLQKGFEKLVTDVVTDVKDTIDCTVVAVESALSIGVNDAWYRKCHGVALPKTNEHNKDDVKQPLRFIGNKQMIDNIHQDISKRLENPLSDIEDKFRQKNQDLESINEYLKSELVNISSTFDEKLKRIDKDEKSTLDSVVQYINKIHSVEHIGNSSSDAKEIQKILKRPTKNVIADMKNTNANKANMNNILISLGHHSNIIDHNIPKDEKSHTHPRGFEELLDKNGQNKSEEFRNTGKNAENLPSHTLNEGVDSMDRLFGGSSANSESRKELLEETRKLLEESERSSSIISNLFQKVDQSGKNIFDTL